MEKNIKIIKMVKNKINIWKYIILGLMVISGYMLYWTNMMRVEAGFFEDGLWIFWNNFAYVVFFGLVTGFVLSNLIGKVKK